MSDETPAQNPPPPKSSPLLEPEEKGIGDYLIPGLLGVAGAALLYKSMSKKKSSNGGSSSKVEASDNEVKFSKGYSNYAVGKDWEEMTLEPYLAEQAEEGNLITADYADDSMVTVEMIRPSMKDSRAKTLAAFRSTHKVGTTDGEVPISKLPSKSGVQKFNAWLDTQVEKFQEEY